MIQNMSILIKSYEDNMTFQESFEEGGGGVQFFVNLDQECVGDFKKGKINK